MENCGMDLELLISSFRENLLRDKMQVQQAINRLTNSSENLSPLSVNFLQNKRGEKRRQWSCDNKSKGEYEDQVPGQSPHYLTDGNEEINTAENHLMLGTNRLFPIGNYHVRGQYQQREKALPPKYGLPGLGEYEEKRKKLQEEWKQEYNNYLRENANQPRHRVRHIYDKTLDYEEVLAKKREEELNYRRYNGDPIFSNDGLRPARSDGYLNQVPMPGGYSVGPQSEVEDISGTLNRIQHYNNELLARENDGFDPYSNGLYARPHSYPTESNTGNIYFPSAAYHSDGYPLYQPTARNGNAFNDAHLIQHQAHRPPENGTFESPTNLNEAKKLSYQEELSQQVEEARRRKQLEKEEQLRYDRKLEEESQNYNPWGRGGGGAPLRDQDGRVIASRNQLLNGNVRNKRAPPRLLDVSPRSLDSKDMLPAYAISRSPTHSRIQERKDSRVYEDYQKELQKQIEEKKKREQEEKEKERLEDERLMHRIQQDNEKMQRASDEEMKKQRQRDEERRHRNEELQKRLEEQRKEAERLKKEEREKRRREQKEAKELSLGNGFELTDSGRKSPPLPSLKTKQNLATGKPVKIVSQKADERQNAAVKNASVTGKTTKDNLLSQLSVMRQQLEKEQQIMQEQLQAQMQNGYEIYDKKSNFRRSDNKMQTDLSNQYNGHINARKSSPVGHQSAPAPVIASNPPKGVDGYETPSPKMQNVSERFEWNNLNAAHEESEYQYSEDQLVAQKAAKQRYLSTLKDNPDEIKDDTFLDEFLAKNIPR